MRQALPRWLDIGVGWSGYQSSSTLIRKTILFRYISPEIGTLMNQADCWKADALKSSFEMYENIYRLWQLLLSSLIVSWLCHMLEIHESFKWSCWRSSTGMPASTSVVQSESYKISCGYKQTASRGVHWPTAPWIMAASGWLPSGSTHPGLENHWKSIRFNISRVILISTNIAW